MGMGAICYSLFASADSGINPYLASRHPVCPSAVRGIAVMRVDKFLYPGSKRGWSVIFYSDKLI